MTNDTIMQAAIMLDTGWCISDLLEPSQVGPDKHCAVGAVAAVTGTMVFEPRFLDRGEPFVDEDKTYENFNALPEGKILAEQALDTDWFNNMDERDRVDIQTMFDDGEYAHVVFTFNDDQDSKDEVIKMFKKASRR